MANISIRTAEGIQKFRYKVEDTVEDLEDQLKRTEASIEEVSEQWKDNQFAKFQEGFEEDKEVIRALCKTLERWDDEVLYDLQKLIEEWDNL